MTVTIGPERPTGADLRLLFERHTAAMFEETPPESIHMMDAAGLDVAGVSFFVMREDGRAIGMGAFKRLSDPSQGEIKSMHVLAECRGRGLARMMLDHLVAEARAAGMTRLWLETGTQPGFAAARALYLGAGFTECPPFEGYVLDPNSVFMTKALD